MPLTPLKSWDDVPTPSTQENSDTQGKGWLQVDAPAIESIFRDIVDEATTASEEPTPAVTEPTGGLKPFTSDPEPFLKPSAETSTSISDTVDAVFKSATAVVTAVELTAVDPEQKVPLDTVKESEGTGEVNEIANKEETILDLTFDVMRLYNLPYDLTRAFELACSADGIRISAQDLENAIKLLNHRLAAADSNEILTSKAIPLEMSPDWIIDILSLKFLYGKCVDAILNYAQTGNVQLLKSAIQSLQYRLGMIQAEENL